MDARKIIKLTESTQTRHVVLYAPNDVVLGEFLMDVDGFFYFWFDDPTNGHWDGYVLRAIADMQENLNQGWNDEIGAYFDKQLEMVIDFQI